jgi:hypothetical protein
MLVKNTTTSKMVTPQLYRQLPEQLGQWVNPRDFHHPHNCAQLKLRLAMLGWGIFTQDRFSFEPDSVPRSSLLPTSLPPKPLEMSK